MTKKTSKFLYLDTVEQIVQDFKNEPYFTPLKSERELSERYGVSRPTIRKAVEELEKQKKVLKIPGKGSVYVGREDYIQPSGPSTQVSFFNSMMMRGDYVNNKVLTQNVIKADDDISIRLNIKKNSSVFHLERLRFLNGNVTTLENSYIPFSLCPQLIQLDFSSTPLHNTLRDCGINILHAKRIIEVVNANDYEAMYFNIQIGDPVVIIQTTSFDENEQIVEYVLAKAPASKIRLEIDTENKVTIQ